MAKIDCGTTIKRSIEDVFAVLSDASNYQKWASGGVVPAERTSEGPIGVGTTWHGVGQLIGRQFDSDFEYTEFEANRRFVSKLQSPFPATLTFTLEPVGGGTRVSESLEAEPAGFFKMAEPLLVNMARRQLQKDLDNLRDLM